MNQYQWTFLDHTSRRHTVGLAHGAESGHLVVHCDMRVVTIDFEVLEPKSYSFFVEEELCHLKIEGSPQMGFTYKFDIDRDVDTAVNRERKAKQLTTSRADNRLLAFVMIFIALLLGGISYWGYSSTQDALPTRLRNEGRSASALYKADGHFEFFAEGRAVREIPLGQDPERLAKLQELVTGDPEGAAIAAAVRQAEAFPVLFREGKPRQFIVDWQTVFRNLEDPLAKAIPAADFLAFGLSRALPDAAGAATCALRVASKSGGYYNQLSLLDAYLLNKTQVRQRWESTFKEDSYSTNLRRACPPPAAESTSEDQAPTTGNR